jgi:hypothetical protein
MSGAVCLHTRHARQLQYTMDTFCSGCGGFLRALLSGACLKRTSRRSTGVHRASARPTHVNALGEARRLRRPRSWRLRSAMASRSCPSAPIAMTSPCAKLRCAGNTVEERLRRSNVRTSNRSAAPPAPRKRSRATVRKRPATETAADTVDTVGLAKRTLQSICDDFSAPAAARAQAARTLLELAGALKNATPDTARKAPGEMTLAEVDERLAALARDDA